MKEQEEKESQSAPEESRVKCQLQSSVEETDLKKQQLAEAEAIFKLPKNFEHTDSNDSGLHSDISE